MLGGVGELGIHSVGEAEELRVVGPVGQKIANCPLRYMASVSKLDHHIFSKKEKKRKKKLQLSFATRCAVLCLCVHV